MKGNRPVAVLLTSHWVSLLGTFLVTTAALLWIFALPAHARGHVDNPYVGIVLFLVLPLVFFLGLALIPIGAFLSRRRLTVPVPDRAAAVRKLLIFLGATTLANVVIGSQLSYRAIEHMETKQFCGESCHVMRPESLAHAVAPHAAVACVTCHVSPGATGWIQAEVNGSRQLIEVVTNSYTRPIPAGIPSGRLVTSDETCKSCHTPAPGRAVRVRVLPHYAEDAPNTPTFTVLAMRVGGEKLGGIHGAHFGGGTTIRFAATDPARQSIPWVEVTRGPAGPATAFFGKDANAASVAALPKITMQCVDCHNRPAHTFEQPAVALDRAIATGEISRSLPFIKKRSVELLKASYSGEDEARSKIVSDLRQFYSEKYPDVAAARAADIDGAAHALSAIWSRNVFPDLKVTWGTYPDNLGHENAPGCFRCHDGEHTTADGKTSIEQDCASCHEPIAVDEANPPILQTLGLQGLVEGSQSN